MSLAHLQHFTCQAIDDQLTTSDPEHVEVLLHIGETGWVGLKVYMAAGCDRNAVPVCLESTVGINVFDGPLNVLGLTTSRVEYELPPPDEFCWLSIRPHCAVPQLLPPNS
jgi:hypothetical protein